MSFVDRIDANRQPFARKLLREAVSALKTCFDRLDGIAIVLQAIFGIEHTEFRFNFHHRAFVVSHESTIRCDVVAHQRRELIGRGQVGDHARNCVPMLCAQCIDHHQCIGAQLIIFFFGVFVMFLSVLHYDLLYLSLYNFKRISPRFVSKPDIHGTYSDC